jgi:hypothetical protein
MTDLRNSTPADQLKEFVNRAMLRVNTCIPGIIESFDATKQTVKVTPAIKMRTYFDNVIEHHQLPPIIEVPIVFPTAAGFALTVPVSEGDACLLMFSQRAIDNWHNLGGIQPPEEGAVGSRHHDLTDAFAIMAPVALPDVFSNWLANGIELRNSGRTSRVTVLEDSIEIVVGSASINVSDGNVAITGNTNVTINGSGGITVNGPVTVNGTLMTTGALSSQTSVADPTGDLAEIRTAYNTHTHTVGPDTSSGPSALME